MCRIARDDSPVPEALQAGKSELTRAKFTSGTNQLTVSWAYSGDKTPLQGLGIK